MKTHYAIVRDNQYGGHSYRTLCGREHSQSQDGVNSSGEWAEVTCKFCLNQRAVYEKREALRAARAPATER